MPKLLPTARILSLADVYRLLGRQVADDAIQHGWLSPCCQKAVPRGPSRRLFDLNALRSCRGPHPFRGIPRPNQTLIHPSIP
jgi:hypothetical protein